MQTISFEFLLGLGWNLISMGFWVWVLVWCLFFFGLWVWIMGMDSKLDPNPKTRKNQASNPNPKNKETKLQTQSKPKHPKIFGFEVSFYLVSVQTFRASNNNVRRS
jgi:hypothetical protein